MTEMYNSQLTGKTLAAAITSGAATLTLSSVPVALAAGTYRLRIDSEICSGVYSGSGLNFTSLARGLEGTTAAAHRAGVVVRHVLSGESIQQLLTVADSGGSPSLEGVRKLVVSPGSLSVDPTTRTATITTGGGGGSSATAITITVANATGSTIPKGAVVADAELGVGSGGAIKVLWMTAGIAPLPYGYQPLGVLNEDIPDGGTGLCTTFGAVVGAVDTSGFSVGDSVFLTNTGGFAINSGTGASTYAHFIGYVLAVGVTGSLFVLLQEWDRPIVRYQESSTGGDGHLLVYDQPTGRYKPTLPASSALVTKRTTHLTSTDILALNTTPFELIPAPASGLTLLPLSVFLRYRAGATPYASSGSLDFRYAPGTGASYCPLGNFTAAGFLDQATDQWWFESTAAANGPITASLAEAQALLLVALSAITVGDGTLDVTVTYTIA